MSLDVAKRIRWARQKKGMSQRGLSIAMKRDPSYIAQLERGTWNPGAEALLQLERILNVSADWLLKGG